MASMSTPLVIKIGSLGVTHPSGGVDAQKLKSLVADIAALRRGGRSVVLVSSGAINAGRGVLTTKAAPEQRLALQQALAAVGMPELMAHYQRELDLHGLRCAQVLLTHEDFRQRERFLNLRQTLLMLLGQGILPIINENDTVSTREISVGDNDQLAAMVAEAIDATGLILLTEADGLYDRHPSLPEARHFPVVDFRDDFKGLRLTQKTSVGRGGMHTKLEAVRRLTPLGQDVVIASFTHATPVLRALQGGGTLFRGDPKKKVKKRLAWIASVARVGCALVIDEGARDVLLKGRSSLLPVGIKKVLGTFRRGDAVSIKCQRRTVAVGIVEYDARELEKIAGKKSQELESILREVTSLVAVHKDNLFLTQESGP